MGNFKTLILLFLLIWQSSSVVSQEEEKTNPVLFAEFFAGGTGRETSALMLWAELNYQQKKNLFTFRYTSSTAMGLSYASPGLTALPFPVLKSTMEKMAVLYGRWTVREGYSKSFSFGPAITNIRFMGMRNRNKQTL